MNITLEEWRRMTGMVQWLQQVKKAGEYPMLRDMLEVEHPRHVILAQPSEVDALIRLGRIEGFDQALNILDAASVLLEKEPEPLETTFEPPDTKE